MAGGTCGASHLYLSLGPTQRMPRDATSQVLTSEPVHLGRPWAWECGLEHNHKGMHPFLPPLIPVLYLFLGPREE